jgi:regulator of protease activity HflC (stomatin/prohibitin superfamily)
MTELIRALIELLNRFTLFDIIEPWELGIRVRFGKFVKDVGPGMVWTIPIFDQVHLINIRKQVVDLPNQAVETKDRIPLEISGTLTYNIRSARKIWLDVQDHDKSLVTRALAIIAEAVNRMDYTDITIDKLVLECYTEIRREGFAWGCEVESLGITDFAKHRVIRLVTNKGAEWPWSND